MRSKERFRNVSSDCHRRAAHVRNRERAHRTAIRPTADDAFAPVHVAHLPEHCPELAPYLGLAPGWRVLVAPGYVDVWYDRALLDV